MHDHIYHFLCGLRLISTVQVFCMQEVQVPYSFGCPDSFLVDSFPSDIYPRHFLSGHFPSNVWNIVFGHFPINCLCLRVCVYTGCPIKNASTLMGHFIGAKRVFSLPMLVLKQLASSFVIPIFLFTVRVNNIKKT